VDFSASFRLVTFVWNWPRKSVNHGDAHAYLFTYLLNKIKPDMTRVNRPSIRSIFERNASLDRPAVDSKTQVLCDVCHTVNCRSIKRSVPCENATSLWLWVNVNRFCHWSPQLHLPTYNKQTQTWQLWLCKCYFPSGPTSDISVMETITETEIIDRALTKTETMLIYETEII